MIQTICGMHLTHGDVPISLLLHPQGLIAVMEPHSSFHIHLTCAPETTILCAVGGLSVKTGNEIDWDHDPGYRIRADGKLDLTGFEQYVAPVIVSEPVSDEVLLYTPMTPEEEAAMWSRLNAHTDSPQFKSFVRRLGGEELTPSEVQTDVKYPFLSKGRKTRFLAIEVRWYAPVDGRYSTRNFSGKARGIIGCSNADLDRSRRAYVSSLMRDWERSKKPEMTRMIICVPHSQLRRFGIVLPL